jgi:plastocyanin
MTNIAIEAGSTVTFTSSGDQPHNAAGADTGGWTLEENLGIGAGH